MKYNILIFSFLVLIILCTSAIADNNYIINDDTVYIDDSKVYLSTTPHTLSSSGWVYFNLTSKIYTGNIDACWGFNTSVSKPTKAELYKPYWINTTTNHEKTFYNLSFITYTGDDLDYGNSYNTNYRYTIKESIVNDNGTTYIISNAAFDSFDTDGTNYTVYWYNRHDNYYLWEDFSSSFSSIIFDYEGYDKWYYIKNILITSNKEYIVRAWIDVPVSTEKQSGKYYFSIKPSGETIPQAVNNGHFYNLDPWWNATWSNRKTITLTGTGSQSFNNPVEDGDVYNSTKRSTQYYIIIGKSVWGVHRGYSEWDISTIPSDAIITKAIFEYHGYSNAEDCIIKNINIQPSISSASDIYTVIGSGNIYADITGFPEIGNNKQIILNDNATSDIQSAISTDWFAIGFINKDESNVNSQLYSEDYVSAMPAPTLCVEYTSVSEGGNNQTDYQLLLNITYESEMQSDFDDLRFSNETHELDAWLESKVDNSYALVWVKFPTTPANGVDRDYYMYYGNAGAASDWDGDATFLQYHGPANADYLDALVISPTNIIYGARVRVMTASRNIMFGLSNTLAGTDDLIRIEDYHVTNFRYLSSKNDGVFSQVSESPAWTVNQWYRIKITNNGTTSRGYVDDDEISTGLITNLPNENLGLWMKENIGSGEQEWAFVRKYVANPPTYTYGSEEYYIPTSTTITNETKLIMSEITLELKGIKMGNYLVYAFILIGILLIILLIQILNNCIYRG